MKNQTITPAVDGTKVASIVTLFVTATLLIIMGVALSVYSVVNNISFSVLNSSIHGAVWGAVITFLGIRYFMSVQRLKAEVYKSTSQFSWSNFKTEKVQKKQPAPK